MGDRDGSRALGPRVPGNYEGLRYFEPALFLSSNEGGQLERRDFARIALDYFFIFGRAFPWRETEDPWAILVSEVMLQQTQTDRVVPKYRAFLEAFPRPKDLAGASVETLFGFWKGLGYNRRALALQKAARAIVDRGAIPREREELQALPGIGPYTAGAIRAFAFHQFDALIETNIRTVYLTHFYPQVDGVADSLLMPLIAASFPGSGPPLHAMPGTLGEELNHPSALPALFAVDPRIWYYALMDYGAYLKRRLGNPNRLSAHYVKQSPFKTSTRRIRGEILAKLHAGGRLTRRQLEEALPFSAERVGEALAALVKEGFVADDGSFCFIKH